jgi:hypothetical protein
LFQQATGCPLWVILDRRRELSRPAHFRFAPKTDVSH